MRTCDTLDAAVDALLAQAGPRLVLAAPLGLGKPHRLLNAITRRVAGDDALAGVPGDVDLFGAAVFIEEQSAVLVGGEETGADRIDPHPFGRPFACQEHRQVDHRSLGGGDAVLGVQRVRRHHVHDCDILGIGEFRHVGITEDIALREAVLGRPFKTFCGVPGDDACKIDILSGGQFGRDTLFTEAAESAEGDTEFALPGALRPDERIHTDDRGCGEGGSLKEGTAAEMIHVFG